MANMQNMISDLKDLWSSSCAVQVAAGVGVVVVSGAIVKRYFGGGVCASKARLDGKTVIVTGANTGIGKETALDLASRGARVILACRNEEKAVEAAREIITKTKSHQVLVRKLDLSSFESVRKFAAEFNKEEERLDILVNNAGLVTTKYELTADGFESTIQVNYLSQFLLTLLLIKKLKSSSPSRVVNVSSHSHYQLKSVPDWVTDVSYTWAKYPKEKFKGGIAYSWSKLQQILFTNELTKRLAGSDVTVNALHPGVVKTDIGRNIPLFNNILFKVISWLPVFLFFKTCKQGAQTTIHCAVDESLQGISGLYFSDCKPIEPSKLAKDGVLAAQLWDVSEELTGMKWEDVNDA